MLAQDDTAPEKARIPLDHPEIDALDLRIRALIFSGRLNEAECGLLIKQSRLLQKVDHRLARRLFGRPLPRTALRPQFFDDNRRPMSDAFGRHDVECLAGWVHRLRECVERLERRNSIALTFAPRASVGSDDI